MTQENVTLRKIITHPDKIRAAIHANIIKAISGKFPLVGHDYTAFLDKIWIEHTQISQNQQKLLLLAKGNASEGVYVTLAIKDKQGKTICTVPRHRIMSVPYFTNRYTFLLDGNEYNIVNQLRIKSGVYTRVRGNDELESSFNLAKGANFKLVMDANTGVFKVSILHSTLPMYAVLKILGADDGTIRTSLGDKLFESNNKVSDSQYTRTIDTLYSKLVQYKTHLGNTASKAEKIQKIKDYFDATGMNPETTAITLGSSHTCVSYNTILEASKKILRLYNSKDEVDERDNLEFQTIHCVEDLIAEVINKDSYGFGKLKAKFNTFKSTGKIDEDIRKIKELFNSIILSKSVRSFIANSTISRLQSQINPLELMDNNAIVTRMGEGAIGSIEAVPGESRSVHYSHMGWLDPIATPESSKTGIDSRATINAIKGSDNEIYKKVLNLRTNKLEARRVIEMYDKYVGIPDSLHMKGKEQPTDMVPAIYKDKLLRIERSKLDYIIPSPHELHTITTNTIPLANANQANRLLMGAKHLTQALPLKNGETRLVESNISSADAESTVKRIGDFLIPKAPVDGKVQKIDDDYIHIKSDDGSIWYCFYEKGHCVILFLTHLLLLLYNNFNY